jgi:hypothetical protein
VWLKPKQAVQIRVLKTGEWSKEGRTRVGGQGQWPGLGREFYGCTSAVKAVSYKENFLGEKIGKEHNIFWGQ